jgi:DNA topoisomerase VI subunit B
MNDGPVPRDPDQEIADALNDLVRKLKGRQTLAGATVDRARKHKRTLDKVIPKLSKIAAEITGEDVSPNGRVESLPSGHRSQDGASLEDARQGAPAHA